MKILITILVFAVAIFVGLYYYDHFVVEAYDVDHLNTLEKEGYLYATFSAG